MIKRHNCPSALRDVQQSDRPGSLPPLRPYDWIIVPMTPSNTRIRWLSACFSCSIRFINVGLIEHRTFRVEHNHQALEKRRR